MTNEELIAKIREEVERQIALLPTVGYSTQIAGDYIPVQNTLNYLLSFLSTLEEQAKEVSNPIFDECVANVDADVREEVERNIDRMLESPVSEGLEEEISRTYHDGSVADTSDMDHVDYENIARHFAEWQKEQDDKELSEKIAAAYQLGLADKEKQMLKEAVEGRVISNDGISFPVSNEIHRLKLMEGDKVRIIICKKEGEK